MDLRTIRFTSKYHNKSKLEKLLDVDEKVLFLKNEMSIFIFNNFKNVLFDKKIFLKEYKQFKIAELSAWETQSLFQDIIILYENQFHKRKQNVDFKIQLNISTVRYKRNSGNNVKGDLKTFELKMKKTKLCKVLKYLVFCDLNKELPKEIVGDYSERVWFNKLINFVKQKQMNLIKSVKLIRFTTGTYRKSTSENGKSKDSYIYEDNTNSLYNWWYCYKIGKSKIHIPLQISKKYHKNFQNEVRFNSECYIKIDCGKINILTTKIFNGYTFKDFTEYLGVDINVKHNFCCLSNGLEIDYDRVWVKQAIKELKKIDRNKTNRNKKRLSKICNRNEWYIKKLIFQILNLIEKDNISDVVLEDLNLSFGATFIKNQEFEIKYSRLIRILRLSNVKTWFIEQANKRGIRVHLTNPAYTSQTCNKCGNISKDNRKTQEVFSCTNCGYTINADYNSAINIKNRISLDVLKDKLHTNLNGIYTPKIIKLDILKRSLEIVFGDN